MCACLHYRTQQIIERTENWIPLFLKEEDVSCLYYQFLIKDGDLHLCKIGEISVNGVRSRCSDLQGIRQGVFVRFQFCHILHHLTFLISSQKQNSHEFQWLRAVIYVRELILQIKTVIYL